MYNGFLKLTKVDLDYVNQKWVGINPKTIWVRPERIIILWPEESFTTIEFERTSIAVSESVEDIIGKIK
jgi:hypothetical protein